MLTDSNEYYSLKGTVLGSKLNYIPNSPKQFCQFIWPSVPSIVV